MSATRRPLLPVVDRPGVTRALAWLLIGIGSLQMTGTLLSKLGQTLGAQPLARAGDGLRALGMASAASPFPKVFSNAEGLDTFASRFTLAWEEPGGTRRVTLTSELYARLRGPYWRRNVFGAAIAYGPVLARNEVLAPLLTNVLRYGLGEPGPLLGEFGLDASKRLGPLRIEYRAPEGEAPFHVLEVAP